MIFIGQMAQRTQQEGGHHRKTLKGSAVRFPFVKNTPLFIFQLLTATTTTTTTTQKLHQINKKEKQIFEGSRCGPVGRAVTRRLQFESSHRQNLH